MEIIVNHAVESALLAMMEKLGDNFNTAVDTQLGFMSISNRQDPVQKETIHLNSEKFPDVLWEQINKMQTSTKFVVFVFDDITFDVCGYRAKFMVCLHNSANVYQSENYWFAVYYTTTPNEEFQYNFDQHFTPDFDTEQKADWMHFNGKFF